MRYLSFFVSVMLSIFISTTIAADNKSADSRPSKINVYQLLYQQSEPGIEPYRVRMLVSKRYMRIDEMDDDSGYIVYDDQKKTIYSVSHFDKRILVIKPGNSSATDSAIPATIEYLPLTNAPKVAGKTIYNYRVYAGKGKSRKTCMDIQLAAGLLPVVRKILKNYQQLISAQQVVMLKNTIKEVQTPCYLLDQIYNKGLYYDKGLPVQEWHSNKKSNILVAYKRVQVNAKLFTVPETYSRFSIPPK